MYVFSATVWQRGSIVNNKYQILIYVFLFKKTKKNNFATHLKTNSKNFLNVSNFSKKKGGKKTPIILKTISFSYLLNNITSPFCFDWRERKKLTVSSSSSSSSSPSSSSTSSTSLASSFPMQAKNLSLLFLEDEVDPHFWLVAHFFIYNDVWNFLFTSKLK